MRDWDIARPFLNFPPFLWITLPMRDWDVIKEILVSLSLKNRITLPMRDWDYSISLVCEFLSWGLHYLWGIETLYLLESYYHWFTDYITYEGLRPFFSFMLYTSLKGLHYLWGIETIFLCHIIILLIIWITLPMRDWDKLTLPSFSCNITRITLPMRDWD